MTVHSEMQAAELQIREILNKRPGLAMRDLMEAYAAKADREKESFVAVLIGHLASRAGASASAETA